MKSHYHHSEKVWSKEQQRLRSEAWTNLRAETQIGNDAMRYRAFFSYARGDEKVANWLHRQLDWFRTPQSLVDTDGAFGPVSQKLHPIFRDRTDLQAGGQLDTVLQQALENSEALIVLCSPTSAKSKWVNHECETFIRLGRQSRIFPVIASGEPDSGDQSSECFPPALRGKGLLAADLREIQQSDGRIVGDGKETGRLKLIAGLLGIPLDTLVRRERRRQRAFVGVIGLAACLFLATAIVAVLQSISATEQRNAAIVSLGRVTAQQAWRSLEEGDVAAAARFGLAGTHVAPELGPTFRDVLGATVFDAGRPRTLARFANPNHSVVVGVSSDLQTVLFAEVSNWGSVRLVHTDIRSGEILATEENVGCDMRTVTQRLSFRGITYNVGPCVLGTRLEPELPMGRGTTATTRAGGWRIEGDQFGWVHVYDADTGRILSERRLHDGEVTFLAVVDGQIVSYGEDGRLLAWTAEYERRAAHLIDGTGTDNTWGGNIDWTTDGTHVVYLSAGRPIVFDAVEGEITLRIDRDAYESRLIAGDALVLLTGEQVQIMESASGGYRSAQNSEGEWRSLAVSQDGSRFGARDNQNRIVIWRASGIVDRTIQADDGITTFAITNGNDLILGMNDGTLRHSEIVVQLFEQAAPVSQVQTSNSLAVAANSAGYLATYDLTSSTRQRSWRAHDGSITALDISPDGRMIASTGSDGRVRVWNAMTGNKLAEFQLAVGDYFGLPFLAFSPNSQLLAISRNDNSAEIWNVSTLMHDLAALRAELCSQMLTPSERAFSTVELEVHDFLQAQFVEPNNQNDVCR